jgi:threonine/homoserine/homoserine lactone efflux protein
MQQFAPFPILVEVTRIYGGYYEVWTALRSLTAPSLGQSARRKQYGALRVPDSVLHGMFMRMINSSGTNWLSMASYGGLE